MKLGIVTDIHNNIAALEAVMAQFQQEKCDRIICCGDIIGIGPCPEQTVQYMMKIPNLIAVRGNHERYLLEGMPAGFPNAEQMDYGEVLHHKWEHGLLSGESVVFLRKLPLYECLTIDGYKIVVMHYCMNVAGQYVNYTPNPSKVDLLKMFADVADCDIVLFGHDHDRTICNVENKWFINVGLLGCPAKDKNLARAGILVLEDAGVRVETIEAQYDVESVIKKIDRLDYPEAENIKKYFYGV